MATLRKPTFKKWLYLLTFSLLLTSAQAKARRFPRHEYSFWNTNGISTLKYKPNYGNRNSRLGTLLGVGYTYYYHYNWGIHTGMEYGLYNATFHMRNFRDTHTRYGFDDLTPGWTGKDELIDYHTEFSIYSEHQQLQTINIPLTFQFQTPLSGGLHQLCIFAGAKLSIPIQSTYRVTGSTLYTWYYDYKSNQEFRPDPTGYGTPYLEDLGCFYNYPYTTERRPSQFKIAGSATLEMGAKWWLTKELSIYLGMYLDYGFNNISKQSTHHLFEFESEIIEMVSSSILTSQYASKGEAETSFTNKVVPLSFGIKVRMSVRSVVRRFF
jgi:hypothetical protein